MVVAEAVDARITRKLRLPLSRFRKPKVIEAEIRRDVWLIVVWEERPGARHVAPFRKPFAPPLVVLRNRMELRQVERDQP